MKPFVLIGITLLTLLGLSKENVQLSFNNHSLLTLKESNSEGFTRKNAKIAVNECSAEILNLILGRDQVLKLEVSAYSCLVKKLESYYESCSARCALLRRIGKCKGVKAKLDDAKRKYGDLRKEQNIWSKYLHYCIKCKSLTEYQLIQSKASKSSYPVTGENSSDDPAYTISNLFESFLSREISSIELIYIVSKSDNYEALVKKLCNGSKVLCKCAKESLKKFQNDRKMLRTIVGQQDSYQKRWIAFNLKSGNSLPNQGEPLDTIRGECRNVLALESEIMNESGAGTGASNSGFEDEESATTTL